MVERFIAPVLKTGELKRFRGFESRSLRHLLGMKDLHRVGGVIKAESEQNSEHSHPSLRRFPMCFGPKTRCGRGAFTTLD